MVSKKSPRPTDAELATTLGKSSRHWDDFIAGARRKHPKATTEWRNYATGWIFLIRDKRRNLAYLRPEQGQFTVSFAFREDAVAAAEASPFPAKILTMMRESPVYPEGRAVRLVVTSAAGLRTARKLLEIKIQH